MNDIQIGDQTYRIGKLSAMQQWHVARRWMPVALATGVGLMNVTEADAKTGAGEAMTAMFSGMVNALGKMSDADSDHVVNACLGVCMRKQGEQFAPVRSAGGIMFDDIDVSVMMRLVLAVIEEHRLGDFMSVLPIAPP